MSSYTQYRESPPGVNLALKYLNYADTESVLSAYKRVGMAEFSHSEISDLLDRAMMRKLKGSGIIIKTHNKSKTYTGMWKFKSEMAHRLGIS